MKKLIFTLLFFPLFALPILAQYGGSTLSLSSFDYVTVPDNEDGLLDIGIGFTIEAWVKLSNPLNDQKIVNKADVGFTSAYILGVQDGKVKFEVFDGDGTQTIFFDGAVPANSWVHLAGTYEVGGMMRVYINGQLAGETPASPDIHNYTTNQLVVGAASWDPIYFLVDGKIDEVRYFQAVLDQQTINDWMLLYVNGNHPNFSDLTMYLKADEGMGVNVNSATGMNSGLLTNGSGWAASTAPFKGDHNFYGPGGDHDLGGVWFGHGVDTADILTVEMTLLGQDASVVFSDDTYGYNFLSESPAGYDRSLAKTWRVATQGPTVVNTVFDLSPIDLGNIDEIVLLESDDYEFSSSTVISGNWNANTFSASEVPLTNNFFYTLGFKLKPSGANEPETAGLSLQASPNPSTGQFRLQWGEGLTDARIRVTDLHGRTLWEQEAGNDMSMEVNLGHLPAGFYLAQLSAKEQTAVCRLQVQ